MRAQMVVGCLLVGLLVSATNVEAQTAPDPRLPVRPLRPGAVPATKAPPLATKPVRPAPAPRMIAPPRPLAVRPAPRPPVVNVRPAPAVSRPAAPMRPLPPPTLARPTRPLMPTPVVARLAPRPMMFSAPANTAHPAVRPPIPSSASRPPIAQASGARSRPPLPVLAQSAVRSTIHLGSSAVHAATQSGLVKASYGGSSSGSGKTGKKNDPGNTDDDKSAADTGDGDSASAEGSGKGEKKSGHGGSDPQKVGGPAPAGARPDAVQAGALGVVQFRGCLLTVFGCQRQGTQVMCDTDFSNQDETNTRLTNDWWSDAYLIDDLGDRHERSAAYFMNIEGQTRDAIDVPYGESTRFLLVFNDVSSSAATAALIAPLGNMRIEKITITEPAASSPDAGAADDGEAADDPTPAADTHKHHGKPAR
jgi:hypothetical protein